MLYWTGSDLWHLHQSAGVARLCSFFRNFGDLCWEIAIPSQTSWWDDTWWCLHRFSISSDERILVEALNSDWGTAHENLSDRHSPGHTRWDQLTFWRPLCQRLKLVFQPSPRPWHAPRPCFWKSHRHVTVINAFISWYIDEQPTKAFHQISN